MAKKLDLNKLKDEIDLRKKEKENVSRALGESTSGVGEPKDPFLYSLVKSLDTGRPNSSSERIKLIENKAAIKSGENVKEIPSSIGERKISEQTEKVDMSPEREELLWKEIESRKKQTLGNALSSYDKTPQKQEYGSQYGMVNEGVLFNTVEKITNRILVENFTPLIENAMKDTIIELYAAEKIKEVLKENRDLIKSVVVETIREIQEKNKARKQAT